MNKFQIEFLQQAAEFVAELDEKTRRKVFYNIDKAAITNDPELFKKLNDDIWEFRTKYNGKQIRLFAFWDKRDGKEILVIATHGIIKKTQKTPKAEIMKAEKLRKEYFDPG